ncbi:hypothetical protein GCM10022254_41430 [Actinomadura meridiana]|uniref:Uncharacterized protein n=1 Tax=Actinomadura meridiana TaxID=559626 RepID=A0ABP8C7N7_9ACTN
MLEWAGRAEVGRRPYMSEFATMRVTVSLGGLVSGDGAGDLSFPGRGLGLIVESLPGLTAGARGGRRGLGWSWCGVVDVRGVAGWLV